MNSVSPSMAQQIGYAASAFEEARTGHVPKSVTVVLTSDTLIITLRGALTHAERALANTAEGAARVREYHQQLFANSSNSLLDEIRRITHGGARDFGNIEGVAAPMFEAGAIVHVYVLDSVIPFDVWTGPGVV